MNIHNWHEILKAFCDAESTRFALDKPWVNDGWILATDARILVAVKCSEPNDSPREDRRRPNVHEMIERFIGTVTPNAWPPEMSECLQCGNTGFSLLYGKQCKRCGGEGVVEDRHGMEWKCRTCQGSGSMNCSVGDEGAEPYKVTCDNKNCAVVIENGRFARQYIRLVTDTVKQSMKYGTAEDDVLVIKTVDESVFMLLMGMRKV